MYNNFQLNDNNLQLNDDDLKYIDEIINYQKLAIPLCAIPYLSLHELQNIRDEYQKGLRTRVLKLLNLCNKHKTNGSYTYYIPFNYYVKKNIEKNEFATNFCEPYLSMYKDYNEKINNKAAELIQYYFINYLKQKKEYLNILLNYLPYELSFIIYNYKYLKI